MKFFDILQERFLTWSSSLTQQDIANIAAVGLALIILSVVALLVQRIVNARNDVPKSYGPVLRAKPLGVRHQMQPREAECGKLSITRKAKRDPFLSRLDRLS